MCFIDCMGWGGVGQSISSLKANEAVLRFWFLLNKAQQWRELGLEYKPLIYLGKHLPPSWPPNTLETAVFWDFRLDISPATSRGIQNLWVKALTSANKAPLLRSASLVWKPRHRNLFPLCSCLTCVLEESGCTCSPVNSVGQGGGR